MYKKIDEIVKMLIVLSNPTMNISNLARYKAKMGYSKWGFMEVLDVHREFTTNNIKYKPRNLIEKVLCKYDAYLLGLKYKKEII